MEQDKPSQPEFSPGDPSQERLERNAMVEEFFQRLLEKQDLHRPKPSAEAVAAALQAIQRLGLRAGEMADDAAEGGGESGDASGCPHCGYHNPAGTQFCGMCGAPAQVGAIPGQKTVPSSEAQHHYHHHYHHHFIAGQDAETLSTLGQRIPAGLSAGAAKDPKLRPLPAPGTSRAEALIRQLTQEWALACNNKQIEDLLEFYAPDAMVMRPNVPPVRGTAAIREFFVAALEAGLGDVEMEFLRGEVLGDVAYQAGRCKMLVPFAMGKRREERGKYVMVFSKQKTGEWKAVVDCWATDLGLNPDVLPTHSPATGATKPRRI